MISKVLCFFGFHRLVFLRQLSSHVHILKCTRCSKEFYDGLNDNVI